MSGLRIMFTPGNTNKGYIQDEDRKSTPGWVKFRAIVKAVSQTVDGWNPIGNYMWHIMHSDNFKFHKEDIDLNDPANINYPDVPGSIVKDDKNEIFGDDNCKRKLGGRTTAINYDNSHYWFLFVVTRNFEKDGVTKLFSAKWKHNVPASEIPDPIDPVDPPEPIELPEEPETPAKPTPVVTENINVWNVLVDIVKAAYALFKSTKAGYKSKKLWATIISVINTLVFVVIPLVIIIF